MEKIKDYWTNHYDFCGGIKPIFTTCSLECKHYIGYQEGAAVCQAFPKGIPPEIWLGEVSHDVPYLSDHGIQFEPKESK